MLSEKVAQWVSDYSEARLPSEVVASTKLRILDIVGCIIGARAHRDTVSSKGVATSTYRGTETRSIPFEDSTSIIGAGLINGTAALVLEFDDSHLESGLHSSSPVMAAAFPLAQVGALSGRELIAAIAIGNELTCRLGLVAPGKFHPNGFHPTGIFGTFGGIYAASRCLKLTAAQTADATGIGGSLSSALMASWEDGSAAKSLHAGFSACAAIQATSCAKHGVSGPRGVFDGRLGFFKAHVQDRNVEFAFARVTDNLGEMWECLKIAPKAYPCGHYNQPLIDAALRLRNQHGIALDEITVIRCLMPDYVMPLVAEPVAEKRRPKTSFHGRFSLQHSMAEAMIQGTLDKSSFQECNLTDPRFNNLADKVHSVVDPNAKDRALLGGTVEIELIDGRKLSHTIEHMRGMPQNPMSQGDLIRKFNTNVSGIIPDTNAERVVDMILSLEHLADVRLLVNEI